MDDLRDLLPFPADPDQWPTGPELHHGDVATWAEQHVPPQSASCFADWVCEAWDDVAEDNPHSVAVVLASMLRQWCGEGHEPIPRSARAPRPPRANIPEETLEGSRAVTRARGLTADSDRR